MADSVTTSGSSSRPKDASTKATNAKNTNTITIEVDPDMDPVRRDLLIAQLAPRTTTVLGNLADLQRMGAAVVSGSGSAEEGVQAPPDVDDTSEVQTLADANAPGLAVLGAENNPYVDENGDPRTPEAPGETDESKAVAAAEDARKNRDK